MKNKKIISVIAAVVIIAVIIAVGIVAAKKKPSDSNGTTAPNEIPSAYVTENRREKIKYKKVKELHVSDSGSGDSLSIPVEGINAGEDSSGGMVFICDDGLEAIKKAVDSVQSEDFELYSYIYSDSMRIEKRTKDGRIITYSIEKTVDKEGAEVYHLSDCKASFISESGKYASFKLPYYFFNKDGQINGLDYYTFGACFNIDVSKQEFMNFYENSALYIIKDGAENDFSLEHTYVAADKGNAYPIHFIFGIDKNGKNTVTIKQGTAEQNIAPVTE